MHSLIKSTAIIALAVFTFFGQVLVLCNLVAAPLTAAMVALDSTKPEPASQIPRCVAPKRGLEETAAALCR